MTSTLGLLLASSLPPMPLLAADNSLPSSSLLKLIPEMEFGAPATNATISAALAQEIESSAAALERLGAKDLAVAPTLSDSWRLVYSNGREVLARFPGIHPQIHAHVLASAPCFPCFWSHRHTSVCPCPTWQITNLASGLPLGFALGRTFQPLDVPTGRFENIGQIEHKLGLATASTLVIGDVRRAPLGTLNAAGTVNAAGNRVDVDFRRLVFGLDSVLGRPLDPPLRKVIVPQQKAGVAQPANDVTYLDGVAA